MTESSRGKAVSGRLMEKSSHRLLGLALLPLHYSIWHTENAAFSRTLFLVHIGLFLFWQPFINHKTQIRTRPTIILILAIFSSIYLGGSWAQTIWIVFLIGIMSSYRLSGWSDKLVYITIIVYLLIELFTGLIPNNLNAGATPANEEFLPYLTLGLILLVIAAPIRVGSLRNYSSDLLYSIIAVAIVVLVALTTVIWMSKGQYDYYTALIFAVLTLALILIIFNLIFRPNSEFGLIAQLRDRYLLNLGTPFESFLLEIAEISNSTDNPDDFLAAAYEKLAQLGWIVGFAWSLDKNTQRFGRDSEHANVLQLHELSVCVYTDHALGPSMRAHCKLLVQIVFIFYASKKRERALSQRAHMEAIYETGARLTHDIKNLIHSLMMMLSTVSLKAPGSEELFVKNLKSITQRLQQTLAKLKNPEHVSEQQERLSAWWAQLQDRLQQEQVTFHAKLETDPEIPLEMFDNICDNLLNNALKKRQQQPTLNIDVSLHSTENQLELRVCDSGEKIPAAIVKTLFSAPVKSKSGFGIGLYQAAKQAEQHAYALTLSENENGRVCFCLKQQTA